MSEIPEDVMKAAIAAVSQDGWSIDGKSAYSDPGDSVIAMIDIIPIARAIMAERERSRTALSESEQRVTGLGRLREVTYAVQHNPNCPAKYLVRLVGKSGRIDFKPYGNSLPRVKHETTDILGFGKTLDEAIDNALSAAPALIPSEPHDAEVKPSWQDPSIFGDAEGRN